MLNVHTEVGAIFDGLDDRLSISARGASARGVEHKHRECVPIGTVAREWRRISKIIVGPEAMTPIGQGDDDHGETIRPIRRGVRET